MKKMICVAAAVFAAALTAVSAYAAEWQTAVEETYEGMRGILNYTVYADGDPAEVGVAGCPNNDATEWDTPGVKYEGPNYGGYAGSGIRTNITKYVKSGDKLRISFGYRSESYQDFRFDITPIIEVAHPDGTAETKATLAIAPMSDVWTTYQSGETDPIIFGDGDSVRLVLKNERGFWHINNLKIERYGEDAPVETPYLSDIKMTVNGAPVEALAEGEITINGKTDGSADVYAALYKDGVLMNVKKTAADGAFETSVTNNGADTMKLYAWGGMSPKTEPVTVTSDGITLPSVPPVETPSPKPTPSSMKEKYENDFLIGNIYNPDNQYTDKDILLKHFNIITAENIMKPDYTQPAKGNFTFDNADAMMNFAAQNNLQVIGHAFVWHQQTPAWFTQGSASDVENNMKTHINTMAGRYKGKIKGWDVVNEAISDTIWSKPQAWNEYIRKTGDGGSPWYAAMGEDYLYKAYVYAHNADPDAELYYNDYNLDNENKREAAALLVEYINNRWKKENNTDENLIDAIGMQSHYNVNTRISNVRDSINRFRRAGVHVNITELDVCLQAVGNNGEGTSDQVALTTILEQKQAAKYAELMTLYQANADIIDRVTFWGYSDGRSWRGGMHPLMFNSDLTPKQAYYAIMEPELYR